MWPALCSAPRSASCWCRPRFQPSSSCACSTASISATGAWRTTDGIRARLLQQDDVGVILVFAGRRPGGDGFPEENVGPVGEQTRRLVAELRPRLAIGSAAAGADLLVAGAALEAGAKVEVLLAGSRERFRSES